MKRVYYLGIAFISMFGTSSCSDSFLSVEPASSIGIDGYYNTENHILEAISAAYGPLQWFDYYDGQCAPLCLVYDCMADDIYVGGSNTSDQQQLHLISQYLSDPNKSITSVWTTCYTGINRSNLVIADAESSNLSEDDKAQYIAEARVLRAFYYSILWKLWGNIPFYDSNLTDPFIAEQKKANEIYQLMEADLVQVLDSKLLPMKQNEKWAGRITQAMAAMLYAEYVMYQQDETRYNKALEYMKSIIKSNNYSLQPYENLWETQYEWNDETIFDINYIAKGGKRSWGNNGASGGATLPTMVGISGLNGSPDYVAGWGFGSVSKEAYDIFEEGDKRRDIGILNIDQYIKENASKGITVSYDKRYQNTGLFLRKYLGRIGGNTGCIGDSDLNWDNNLRVYRYAETLLNAAELALRTNDINSATEYLSQIRKRANLDPIEATMDNILLERRREFIGEGKRYFDLVRFGKAKEVLKAKGGKVLDKSSGDFTKDGIPERIQWTDQKRYLPIPQSEIEAAKGTLTQNSY